MVSRPFVALFVAVFVATMGISMVSPLLPVYAKDLGASGVWLGLTFSIFAVVQAVVGPFAGRWSDRYGRKPFIVAGLLIYFVAAVGYLTADSFYQVIAFRAFSGLGTSFIFSVARAYVGDMTPAGKEGRWLGVFAMADILGFGTGPLVAGALRQLVGFHSVFVAMALLMAISAFIILIWLPRHSPAEARRHTRAAASGIPERAHATSFRSALADPLTLALTVHMGLLSLANGATFSLLALRLEDGLGAAPIMIGVAFATQDITAGLAQPFWGRLADRRERRPLVAIGLMATAIQLVLLGIVPAYAFAIVLLLGMGASNALSQVSSGAIQVVAGRRVGMGTVLGLGSAGNGFGMFIGSVVGGLLYDQYGLGAAFLFGGVTMALGVLVFLALTRGVQTSESVAPIRFEGGETKAAAAAGGS